MRRASGALERRRPVDRGRSRLPGQCGRRVRAPTTRRAASSCGRAPAQTGVIAAPVTYSIGDEQYVAVVAGWGGAYPDHRGRRQHARARCRRIAAACWRSSSAAPRSCRSLPRLRPPQPIARVGNDARWRKRGFAVFHNYCAVCHGDAAVGGGVIPDLRWSPLTRDADAWQASCSAAH